MNEELKREFEEKFLHKEINPPNGYDWKWNIDYNDVWLWFESELPKEVEIKEGNVEHTEPLDTEWHKCPNCDNIVIATADNFCASCGSKIKWVGK